MAKDIATKFSAKAKWGRLSPLQFSHYVWTAGGGKKIPVWLFKCDCGATFATSAYSVTSGATVSCGCYAAEATSQRSTRHGASKGKRLTPEYRAWRCMLTRAKNPRIRSAERYALRGIGVAAEWDSGGDGRGFERFLEHVGSKPSPKHSLDRIDNERGYVPGNVRWATVVEQLNNTSQTTYVEFSGQKMPLSVAATMAGINPQVVRDRIRLGWAAADLFAPRARSEFGMGPHSRPGVKPRA